MEKEKLYIPIYVKTEPEQFPGFGAKELKRSIIMSLFLIIISVVIWLIVDEISVLILSIMIGVTGIIVINTKNDANLSMVTYVQLVIDYFKEQQRYTYKYLDEWKTK